MLLSLPITSRFTEDYYNSSVAMTIHQASGTAVAMYHPPRESDFNDPNNTPLGISILRGTLKPKDDQKGAYIFSGTWEYLEGLLQEGIFEMVIDGKGRGKGWWSLGPNQPTLEQTEGASAEGSQVQLFRAEIIRLRKIIQRLRRALEGRGENQATPGLITDLGDLDKVPSEGMPRKITEGTDYTMEPRRYPWKWNVAEPTADKSRVREMLQWFYVKNCVFCSWIFFLMTLVSLLLCSNVDGWFNAPMLGGIAMDFLNYAFMIVYTVIYAYFLVMYFYLQLNPPSMYVLGVFLYTIGYAVFAGFFLLSYHGHMESQMAIIFDYVGSWCFLIGSAALIQSTVPRSWCSKEVFLLLGSVFFLLGSFFFVFDCSAVLSIYLGPYYDIIGNALFLPGRLCFLLGSTSDDCDILCRGAEWQKRGICFCFDNGSNTKDDKQEPLLGETSDAGIRLSFMERETTPLELEI